MKPKNKLYWQGVDERFNKFNTFLKWTVIPTTVIIICVLVYLNFF